MAATNKTPILLYGSTTPTNAPTAGNLTNSSDGCEIAINVADKNLFFKDSTNTVNTVPIRQSSASSNGWLSSTDWNTFNNKQPAGTYVTSVTGTAPVVSSGGTTPAISMAAANGSTNGYLTSTDWTTFNSKAPAVTYTTGYIPYGQGTTTPTQSSSLTFDGTNLSVAGGVYFNSGSSSLLNDYEEGTFTPALYGWTGTYSSQVGTYRKVGKFVFIQGNITTNGGTGTFSQTYPNMTGLPFSINYIGSSCYGEWFGVSGVTTGSSYTTSGPCDYGAATQFFMGITGLNSTGVGNLIYSMLSNASNVAIRFTACYTTA